ncbi:MAG: ADP,ATP carrier protein 1 [Chlamydiales bacterium]|nr:ADP,ATP carrier protein 1 [Chlamydiales bacterium]MCH9635398.1 ADP,ATP carrier protein 1 [Chlamydiales bacterium]MCH9704296.1 NTP/NDP exchange transporter [Chlamydiota bacterium]
MVTLFKRLGNAIWSVQRSEIKKVLLSFALLFFICSCYSVLRNIKDTLILSGSEFGAEVIPFLKVWGILPAVFIANWVYTRLSRRFTKEAVFYILMGGFLSYFLLFCFALYPYIDGLKLNPELFSFLPSGSRGLVAMICSWPMSMFYIISELWSILLLGVVFWGFMNDRFSVKEAKRTYGIINLGSNLSPIVAGAFAFYVTQSLNFPIPFAHDAFHANLIKLISIVSFGSLLCFPLFFAICRHTLKEPFRLLKTADERLCPITKSRKKLSLKRSIATIAKSPYLSSLAFIVLGYNIAINFTDVLWKQQLKILFQDPSQMLSHMYMISFGTGIFSLIGALLFSFLVHRFGWTLVALITPLIMTIMGSCFFICYFFGGSWAGGIAAAAGLSPLALTVYLGSWQNMLAKAGKYSLFDASKELAFLPLSADERQKGKTAIDGLGAGVGKSGSSILYQGLLLGFGGIGACSPVIAVILSVVLVAWIIGAVRLGGKFEQLTKQSDEAPVKEELQPAAQL